MRLTVLILFMSNLLIAQDNKKETTTIRISDAPSIDGVLSEDVWQNLPVLEDFLQYYPYNGRPASQKTYARICYDNEAIYIGAIMHDTAPDSLQFELGERDSQDEPYVELFTIHISPYNDGMNSVYFGVSSSGVQTDFILSVQGHDTSWDAVWESDVSTVDSGWVAEVKIPYSALRFSSKPEQKWGFNLFRRIPRYDEWNSWSYVSNEIDQWWKHMGVLNGIKNVEPPLRLSFSPYVSSYAEKNTKGKWGYSYNGGMDLKYGLSESFTLDMTLIPDFGQVESDDEELNLSPYETQYNEKRQFFKEGLELFNKGKLFYSRRIGQIPVGYYGVGDQLNTDEKIDENPNETQIINVSKLSGRTESGLGIGVLNAMTATTYATVVDTLTGIEREIKTQPFSNYNLLVFDQSLANNSYLSLINSNVYREGHLANVTATEFRFADQPNEYSLFGRAAYSQIYDDNLDDQFGYKLYLEAAKISGQIQYGYFLYTISDNYNQSDFGYLYRNNEVTNSAYFSYNIFEPFGMFLNLSHDFQINYSRMYNPSVFSNLEISYEIHSTFKNNYKFNMHALIVPVEGRDYYEPRVPGRYLRSNKFVHNCFSLTTDRREPFSAFIHGSFSKSYDYDFDLFSWGAYIAPMLRLNDQVNLEFSLNYSRHTNFIGFVGFDSSIDNIIMGKRNRNTLENTLEASYLFNNKMSLSFRLRHYWSEVDYDSYYRLEDDGQLSPSTYNTSHDVNYNAFNIDLVYRWHFAPGSEMLLVWKNSIYTAGDDVGIDYFANFKNTIDAPQMNSFSIKILYYLDYLSL